MANLNYGSGCEVSVVIPTFNYGRYLRRAIASVLAQTRLPDEVIVVDDGSTDETADVVRGFEGVRYIYQANQGVSCARNRGISEARGEWIAFLDGDDWWLPEKLMLQLEAAAACPDAALVYTGSCTVTPQGGRSVNHPIPPSRIWQRLRYRNCISGGSSAMVKREVLMRERGFDERLTACEDWDLWVRLARKYQFAVVPQVVTMIFDSGNSMSTQYERMLGNTELVLHNTLVSDLRGLRRTIWTRRIRSASLFSASISARTVNSRTALMLLLQALWQWPSPFFIPKRFAALGVALARLRSTSGEVS
jgi:glycosyltransferase involved in cell wall biosynthesis